MCPRTRAHTVPLLRTSVRQPCPKHLLALFQNGELDGAGGPRGGSLWPASSREGCRQKPNLRP